MLVKVRQVQGGIEQVPGPATSLGTRIWTADEETGRAQARVCVVVLNWNGWQDTVACIESLRRSTLSAVVVVVDNGSTDGSPVHLRTLLDLSWLELLLLPTNTGFTGGANTGLRRALTLGADYVLLLNNDATVEPQCIERLVAAVQGRMDVGLAGPGIVWADDPLHLWSGGMSIAWHRATILDHRGALAEAFATDRLVQGLSGCALLVTREVLERVGLLDERYFAYYEDLDWCLRARAAGYRALYVGSARVAHHGSASSNRDAGHSQSAFLNYLAARNLLLFWATHGPRVARPVTVAWQVVRVVRAIVLVTAGGLLLRRPGARIRAWALARGLIDAARRRFGTP